MTRCARSVCRRDENHAHRIFPAMSYLTDFTIICLTVGLILGGAVLGQRVGAVAALWGAGGGWLALRFADRMWRPVFTEMRENDAALDFEFWLPVSFALLFAGMLAAVVAWIAVVRPRPNEIALPSKVGEALALFSGGAAGALVLLALIQSQVMSATVQKRMPQAVEWARPVLSALGQERLEPPRTSPGIPTLTPR